MDRSSLSAILPAGWPAVIQWVNPACPPPPELALR
jgi:hypothetical protein